MYLSRVEIKNFRLLREVSLCLDGQTTLIVGRNNSGKTSVTEIFKRFLAEKSVVFRLEDFSLAAHCQFWEAYRNWRLNEDSVAAREMLPAIELRMTLDYSEDDSGLGALGECIVDLDPDCSEAVIVLGYRIADGRVASLLEGKPNGVQFKDAEVTEFYRLLRVRIPQHYEVTVHAEDPTDSTNRRTISRQMVASVVRADFIGAQRGLDDVTDKERDPLARILESLFDFAESDTTLVEDRDLVREITEAVSGIEESLNGEFRQKVGSLLPAFSLFGYPGLSDPHLVTETTLDVRKLLKNHTQVRYAGVNGQTLPETYNGLGARNLIYILLQLYGFFKSFAVDSSAPCVHLIFLEEPEAHLHPQMQQVFVRQIEQLTREFAKRRTDIHSWPVQFVLTTHSPHMANEASFDRLRYFASEVNVDGQRSTRVKDLGHGLGGTPRADRDFLHQYLTLTRCDLLFADKAILIEGTSERLLLPRMSQMIDDDPHPISPLARQYITVMEVGGAYAHRFFGLLDFLGLKTLVITDLDAVNAKGEKCQPAEGTGTSNACIKSWFADSVIDIPALLGKSESDKVKGVRRLAYQIPEVAGGACGRSLEEAFVIANPDLFEIANSGDALEARAGEVAKRANKTAFAIKHAIDVVEWSVPLYIAEGLRWLARTHLPGNVLPQMPQMRQSSPVETADPLGSAVQ